MVRFVLLALMLAGCNAAATPQPTPRSLAGTFTLENGEAADRRGGDCIGTGGYDDMRSGVEVVVRDATGTIVGTDRLAADPAYGYSNGCRYTFSIAPLPASGFYTVTVGSRGEETYSEADLNAMGWTIRLALGG